MERQGVFYAVSVGPGDPELMTRQACRVLEACGIIAAPRMKSGRMLALDIAAGAVDMQCKTVLPLDFTMARDAAVREDSYRTAAAAIKAELAAGRDVVRNPSGIGAGALRWISVGRSKAGAGCLLHDMSRLLPWPFARWGTGCPWLPLDGCGRGLFWWAILMEPA